MITTKATECRAEAYLSALVRYKGDVLTKKEFIHKLLAEGYSPLAKAVPRIEAPSGKRYFSWSNEKMREYTLKRAKAGTKMSYQLVKDDSLYDVSTFEFDLAASLSDSVSVSPQPRAFVLFNMRGQNIPGIRSTETQRPYITVISESALESAERTKASLESDFEGSRVVWAGLARTQEEAYTLAGF